jgi:hypothetical protein
MIKAMAVGVATLVASVCVTLIATPMAEAGQGAPEPDSPCANSLAGALTQLPDLRTVLRCQGQQGGEFRWRTFSSPYPNSDRWLTYGPQLTLHGEGQPNREIDSGDWIAYPQVSGGQCTASQQVVVKAGQLSQPQLSTGAPGGALTLRLLPLLFTVDLTGYCLWQKVQ